MTMSYTVSLHNIRMNVSNVALQKANIMNSLRKLLFLTALSAFSYNANAVTSYVSLDWSGLAVSSSTGSITFDIALTGSDSVLQYNRVWALAGGMANNDESLSFSSTGQAAELLNNDGIMSVFVENTLPNYGIAGEAGQEASIFLSGAGSVTFSIPYSIHLVSNPSSVVKAGITTTLNGPNQHTTSTRFGSAGRPGSNVNSPWQDGIITYSLSSDGNDATYLLRTKLSASVLAPVPEPETYALMLTGAAMLFIRRRKTTS